MDKTGRDALIETREVLDSLGIYLTVVGESAHEDTQVDLMGIEHRMKDVNTKIGSILRKETESQSNVAFFEDYTSVDGVA